MRFLIDANLSPQVADGLRRAGHDAVALRDYGIQAAEDPEVLARAAAEDRVLVSADTDFGTLLARQRATAPSVVLLRRPSDRRPEDQVGLILANLDALAAPLQAGCVVVFDEERVRVRPLPILPP